MHRKPIMNGKKIYVITQMHCYQRQLEYIKRTFGQIHEFLYVDPNVGETEKLAMQVENIIRSNPNNNVVIFATCKALFTFVTAKRVAQEENGLVFAVTKINNVLTLV